jgi:uncharacterized protein (TIGR03435 family)
MHSIRFAGCLALLLLRSSAFAQGTTKQEFDVASIRLHIPSGRDSVGGTIFPDGTVTGTFMTLCDFIRSAYGLRADQLSGGPSWACSDRYDLVAKTAGPSTEDQAHQMMRALLAERFHLALRRDSKEVPVYAMVVSAKGLKLKQSAANGQSSARISSGHITLTRVALPALLYILAQEVDRPILDQTGLSENYYDFDLEWTPDLSRDSLGNGPSLFTAIEEQLGLKLESQKAPQEVFVITRAEKPSEN